MTHRTALWFGHLSAGHPTRVHGTHRLADLGGVVTHTHETDDLAGDDQ